VIKLCLLGFSIRVSSIASLGAAQSFHCFLHWIDFLPVLDFSAQGAARALVKLFDHGPSRRGLLRLGAAVTMSGAVESLLSTGVQ
jgi:hypothetical protein